MVTLSEARRDPRSGVTIVSKMMRSVPTRDPLAEVLEVGLEKENDIRGVKYDARRPASPQPSDRTPGDPSIESSCSLLYTLAQTETWLLRALKDESRRS